MFMWKLAPALATGNTIVIKAAESTPLTALHAAHLCNEAGIPEGVVNVVPGLGEVAGAALAGHHGLNKLAFTGETSTGKLIMKAAAEKLIPVTLELGGKSPSIVFEDADIDGAVGAHQIGLFLNAGQCCCASSRIYVHEKVYDEFAEKTTKATKKRKVGDPFTDVDQGPQQNEEQFKKVLNYIATGEKEGATLLAGGKRIGKKGYFVESTVFGNVGDNMKISREEIFGPVMQITKFKDEEEVLRRANDTQYGLASAVFTRNLDKANYFSRALKLIIIFETLFKLYLIVCCVWLIDRAGTVWINTYDVLDAPQPFGGYKQSGIGREKGEYALSNFTQVKSVIQNLPKIGGWY
ncbi:aldehyde dehydrogenase X, mitochondrial precursor [Reticulomyxa filosa]|uniref:Aldehyde dehydrogenase X, mitochondrial n=1 Tax=Reticulomyxa filosa TaxID=46433 RepID=X6M5Q9_RETFI|nr:aldehyde dehydrogenase X, mitochondrial precursor [Reticulomyxa filosa]|eukprot:ETO08951.1 aldehyde dehydrogenase X, mitochondrial precursor [Reticulomyxa filosa]